MTTQELYRQLQGLERKLYSKAEALNTDDKKESKEYQQLVKEKNQFFLDNKVQIEGLFNCKHIKNELFDFDVFGKQDVTSKFFEESKLVKVLK